jgi:anti-sigma regulatory factor (Ser/Thr protein kinase)
MDEEVTLPDGPEGASFARRAMARAADLWRLDREMTETALLLVSELATNAILHGGSSGPGGTFKVMVCHLPGRLYIGVTDMGSATAPGVVPDPGLATSGRGLRLLAEIAACWGHERSGRGGRTVWFGLDCP